MVLNGGPSANDERLYWPSAIHEPITAVGAGATLAGTLSTRLAISSQRQTEVDELCFGRKKVCRMNTSVF